MRLLKKNMEEQLQSQTLQSLKQMSSQIIEASSPQDATQLSSSDEELRCKKVDQITVFGSIKQKTLSQLNFFIAFASLYRFSSKRDKVLIVVGVILGLVSGMTFAGFTYLWGEITNLMVIHYFHMKKYLDEMRYFMWLFIYLGIASFIVNSILFSIWKVISVSIADRCREKYLRSFLSQPISWLQRHNLFEMSARFKQNCLTLQKAIGDKVALFCNLIGMLSSCMTIAVLTRWTYSVVLLITIIPLSLIIMKNFLESIIRKRENQIKGSEQAEAKALESVSLIKTVKSFNSEQFQAEKYEKQLSNYEKSVNKFPKQLAQSTGIFYLFNFIIFGAANLYGFQCTKGDGLCPASITGSRYLPGETLMIFFQFFMGGYNMLQIASAYQAAKDGIRCSVQLYDVIEHEEVVEDVSSSKQPQSKLGDIEFDNVTFAYPSNPTKVVLKNFSVRIQAGKFNAFAGFTGSGKSTVVQLLLKFYEAQQGNIYVGGRDIRTVSAHWIRSKIGYVGQEPVLFSGSIAENVRVGKPDAQDQQIRIALSKANILSFIDSLPEGLNYQIGASGCKLSGGQKQRIAIARALVKNPEMLILDEATSALDRQTQKGIQRTIQEVLDVSSSRMTVFCIAHRLKTIIKADRICYIQDGRVVETGTFSQISKFKAFDIKADFDAYSQMEAKQKIPQQINTNEAKIKSINQIKYQYFEGAYKVNVAQTSSESKNIFLRLIHLLNNRKVYYFALFLCFCAGMVHPVISLILAKSYEKINTMAMIQAITQDCLVQIFVPDCAKVRDTLYAEALYFLRWIVLVAFVAFGPYYGYTYFLAKVDFELLKIIRTKVYSKVLKMPVSWFENKENEAGTLATRFGRDTRIVTQLLTSFIPTLLVNSIIVFSCLGICFSYNYSLGMLAVYSLPWTLLTAAVTMIFVGGFNDKSLYDYDQSNKVASQLIINIKTVHALNHQLPLLQKYLRQMKRSIWYTILNGLKIGSLYGFSMFVMTTSMGLLAYATSIYISQKVFVTIDYCVVYAVVIWAGWNAGNNLFFSSSFSEGRRAANNLFKILDDPHEEDLFSSRVKAEQVEPFDRLNGKIQFNNVSFSYEDFGTEQRGTIRNVSFAIQAGEKVAFVGPSGCGKSTLLQLLLGFYPYEGTILFDGKDIREVDLQKHRRNFAVILQQPSLFVGTLQQNIRFNSSSSYGEIQEAAGRALILDLSSQGKVDTSENTRTLLSRKVGSRGTTKISGGEKQRAACARALIRSKEATVLILDQGTSALDLETEKRVQRNLEEAFKGKTIINVAHRLETVQNADRIFVFREGQLVEEGSYSKLMNSATYFRNFAHGQKFVS